MTIATTDPTIATSVIVSNEDPQTRGTIYIARGMVKFEPPGESFVEMDHELKLIFL